MSQLELTVDSGHDSLSVRRFAVHEAMSSLFSVSVWARSPDDDIDLESVVGRPASLSIVSGMAHALHAARRWTGVCQQMEHVEAESSGLSMYYVRIAPALWLLTQRHDHYLFQHKSIPDIVGEILDEWGIAHTWKIHRPDYPKLELRTQYGESDFAFISRLLEEAGISYHFAHDAGHDSKAGTKLVLTDAPHVVEPREGGPLPYVDSPNHAAEREFVSQVRISRDVRPGRVTLRDHDFRRHSTFKMLGAASAQHAVEDKLEIYHYHPGAALIELEEAAAKKLDHAIGSHLSSAVHKLEHKAGAELAGVMHKLEAAAGGKIGGVLHKIEDAVAPKLADAVHNLEHAAGAKLAGEAHKLEAEVNAKFAAEVHKVEGEAGKLLGAAEHKLGGTAGALLGDAAHELEGAAGALLGGAVQKLEGQGDAPAADAAAKKGLSAGALGHKIEQGAKQAALADGDKVISALDAEAQKHLHGLAGKAEHEAAGLASAALHGGLKGAVAKAEHDLDSLAGKAGGFAHDKINALVDKKLGKLGMVGDLLGDLAGGIAGELAAKIAGKIAGGVKGQLNRLVGDDKGFARHDEKAALRRSQTQLESLRATKFSISFATNALDLSPGSVFSMENHPRSNLAPDKKLLVTELMLEGSEGGEWDTAGHAVFADQPYRAPMVTPKPTIQGVQSAVVVGPKGQEIHTDEHGRVRVQFHWDREGKHDENSSCWVRVGQGWGGPGHGMTHIPRVGHEVLVAFTEGDPDLPMVIGSAHNNTSRTAHHLPEHKTRSSWRSSSSPGGAGANEIMLEDAKGKELVYMHAERDHQHVVKRNRGAVVGGLDALLVGQGYMLHVSPASGAGMPTTGIDFADGKITLGTGGATITLEGDTVTIRAKKLITIASEDGVHATAKKGISIASHDALHVTAKDVRVQGAALHLEGKTLDLAGGGATLSLKGGAATLHGKQDVTLESGQGGVVARGKNVHLEAAAQEVTVVGNPAVRLNVLKQGLSVAPGGGGVAALGAALSSAKGLAADHPGPYADTGFDAQQGAHYAEAGVVKTTDANTGISVKAMSASAQYGEQNDVSVTGLQIGAQGGNPGGLNGGGTMNVLTANAHFGTHNADGSTGINAGGGATLVGAELTAGYSGWSLTGGLGVGPTAGFSLGTRDSDHDGKTEYCGYVATPAFSLGSCVEKFW